MNIKSKNTQEVMKKEWLYAVGLVCLVSACTGTPQSSADDELCSIDTVDTRQVSQSGLSVQKRIVEVAISSPAARWKLGCEIDTLRLITISSRSWGGGNMRLPVLLIF